MKNSNTVKLTIRQNQMTAAQKKDQQYQADFIEFGYKNPSATELNYLEIKIKLLTKVVNECEETADFDFLGEELDGMELVNGNLITTKTGTASDWFFWKSELDFLKEKQDQLLNPTPLVIEKKDNLKKDYKTDVWFLAGVQLANGKAYQLRKDKLSFRDIAVKLGFKSSDGVYFSESIGNSSKGAKNIFEYFERLKIIIDYCNDKSIAIDDRFMKECTEKYPNEF
ncbi:hypothetical protein [Flavobacterium sp. 14A]|uniref:hypothetical protein n=1 Tax=Flavobacterium sp. 14A TaxID=2735896 RepID=UPI001C2D0206|nr:hypothetical protein [Flavobacterium sp. 14A]